MTIKSKPQTKEFDENYDGIFGVPLYRIPPKTWVRTNTDHKFFFDHLDGMYSYCKEVGGGISHYNANLKVFPCDE